MEDGNSAFYIKTMILLENLFQIDHTQYFVYPIVLFIKCLVVNHLCTACFVRVAIDLIHLCSAILLHTLQTALNIGKDISHFPFQKFAMVFFQ